MSLAAAADAEPADADLERADALIALGRHEAARESLAKVLARDPGNVEALCRLAQALKEAGAPAEMLSVTERANAVAPDEEWPHRLRALALLDLDRAPEATDAARAAVRLAPDGWHGHVVLAAALAAARSRVAGLAPAREAVRLAPQEAAPHYMLGWLLQGMGRTRAARRAFHRTLRCDPQHAEALENLGRMDLQSGRMVHSVRLFRAAAAAAPAAVDGTRHVRRVLIGMAGYAYVAAGLLMFMLALAFDPVAWAIAAGIVIAYGLWAGWVVRRWPPDLRALASVWMRTDPRFTARIRLTVISLVLALCFGAITTLTGTRFVPFLMPGAFAVFMLSALAVVIVDRRPRHRDDGVLFDSDDPAHLSGWQNFLVFRALRMSCLITLVLFAPAVQAEPNWGTRAGLGVPLVTGYGAYLWWLRRRRPTAAGALWRRVPVSAGGLGLGAVVNVAFALAVIGVPDSHRGVLEQPAVGPFVVFFYTLAGQCVWFVFRIRALGLRVAAPQAGRGDAR